MVTNSSAMLKPLKVGTIVSLVSREGSRNGSGDGILWHVTKSVMRGTKINYMRVEPCWSATGATSLRSKAITQHQVVEIVNVCRLGELRMQLDDMMRKALALEAGIEPSVDDKTTDEK
jgi:hypothetical protein